MNYGTQLDITSVDNFYSGSNWYLNGTDGVSLNCHFEAETTFNVSEPTWVRYYLYTEAGAWGGGLNSAARANLEATIEIFSDSYGYLFSGSAVAGHSNFSGEHEEDEQMNYIYVESGMSIHVRHLAQLDPELYGEEYYADGNAVSGLILGLYLNDPPSSLAVVPEPMSAALVISASIIRRRR